VPGVHVRHAEAGDAEAVARLVARLKLVNEELDPHFKVVEGLEEAARRYVEGALDDPNKKVLVAVDDDTGEIVGVIILELVDRVFYEPKLKAVITDFYVIPRYRRRRVGTLLLDKAAEEARAAGAGLLAAVFPAGNSIAEEFYKRRGFKPLQVEYYKPL